MSIWRLYYRFFSFGLKPSSVNEKKMKLAVSIIPGGSPTKHILLPTELHLEQYQIHYLQVIKWKYLDNPWVKTRTPTEAEFHTQSFLFPTVWGFFSKLWKQHVVQPSTHIAFHFCSAVRPPRFITRLNRSPWSLLQTERECVCVCYCVLLCVCLHFSSTFFRCPRSQSALPCATFQTQLLISLCSDSVLVSLTVIHHQGFI